MKVTAVSEPPVYYDLEGSLIRASEIVGRAGAEGSSLVVFPEAWLPGYVDFVWLLTPDNAAGGTFSALYKRLWDNAVDLSTDVLDPLKAAAREAGVVVVIGVQERSGGTLYNSAVVIDADGTLRHRHRKLMPTNAERQVWGFGDGSTLNVVDTAVGRIAVLLCWENYMPLARMALYAQGVDIWCAPTADTRPIWHVTMQHIAMEGGCGVIGASPCIRTEDVPPDLPGRSAYEAKGTWLRPGNTSIIAPGGTVLSGPVREEYRLVHADMDVGHNTEVRRVFDVAGHYARPDVFTLKVDRKVSRPVTFEVGDPD